MKHQIVHMLRFVRVALSLAVVSVVAMLALSGGVFGAAGPKCEYAGVPGIGPCDPDQGYVWQGECYDDDGCYYEIEECCPIPD